MPDSSRDSRYCTTAKIESRKMKTNSRLVRTSTKLGQYSVRAVTRRDRAPAIAYSPGTGLLQRARDRLQQRLNLALLLRLRFDPAADHLLLAAHVLDETLNAFGEIGHRGCGALASRRAGGGGGTCRPGLPGVYATGARWRRAGRRRGRRAAARIDQVRVEVGDRREPVLKVVVEHALRLAGLQVEEAEDERAGQAEQRRRKGDPHADERLGQAVLQVFEDHAGVRRGDVEVLDRRGDRANRLQQAPERPKQPEEDEQAGQVAAHVAVFVEPHLDGFEDRPHRVGGDGHAADAVAKQRRHGGEQHRRPLDLDAGFGDPERVDPTNPRRKTQDLPEGQRDADDQNRRDYAVEAGVGLNALQHLTSKEQAR